MKSMLKSLMSVAVAALAFTSCSNDATEDVMPNVGTKTLKVNATIDQTRTVMADNHVDLDWAKDDQIHLYIGASATEAKSINPVTGGEITGVTYNPGDKVYAYYSLPDENGKETSKSAKEALINIVKEQTQEDASIFAGKNLPMVASSSIENGQVNLVFQPVGCVLVFNVYGQGKTAGEKVSSIKFETSKGCYGYDYCDLTAENLVYQAYSSGKNATVTLTNPATIGDSKPSDTKVGENQIYLVVAQAEYPAGSKFTVTTDAKNAYNFTTTTALDCSAKTARVVNLNLTKAAEMQPSIEVPTTSIENSSSAQDGLFIEGIKFDNVATDKLSKGVYSNAELTEPFTGNWLTIVENDALLESGKLYYNLAANDGTDGTDGAERTAYIGIKCGDAQASIAVTQLAKGKFVTTYVPENMSYVDNTAVPSPESLDNGNVTLGFAQGGHSNLPPKYFDSSKSVHCYKKNTVTVATDASKILKIEIVRNGGGSSKLSVNGSFLPNNNNTFTWTGESKAVELTINDDTFKLKSMKIYYGEDNEPRIEATTTVNQQPAAGGDFTIENIVIKNINVADVTTGVYSDAELTQPLNGWLTIKGSSDLANGTLSCNATANETTESRTAYIGIKYSETVKAAIAVTQKAQGAVDKYFVKVTENLDDWTGTYLIVNEVNSDNKIYAFNGVKEDVSGNKITVTTTEQGGILYDDTDTDLAQAVVKISKKAGTTDKYMLQVSSTSKYVYSTKSNDNDIMFDTSDATATPSTIIIDSGSAKITGSAGSILRFNTKSDQMRFRYFKSSSTDTNLRSIQLYKLQE